MCGRDNPPELTFCQECGQRLAAVAPPPPGAGAPTSTSPLAATAAHPVSAGRPAAPLPARPRPAAPAVSFTKRMTEPQEPGEPSSREPVRVGADTTAVCPGCGAVNQRAARFCTACGQSTVAAADTRPMRVGAFDLTRTVADSPRLDVVAPEAPAPIPPGRVIDVGPAPGHPSVRCSRCSSVCSGDAQFCRFCGQALAAASTPNAATITPTPSSYGARAVEGGAPILRARLVLITRDGSEGRAYLLGASTDLGRSEGGILFPDDQFVSPRHARIVARGSAFVLRDLESTNGVYVRIPFARTGENAESRASVAGEGKRDKPEQTEKMGDKTTIRGHHHSEALSSLREAAAEQPLTDQELFLVGQQVLRFEVVRQAE